MRLICMMGLPRSGKSTVARALSRALGAPVVNRDAIRLAMHGQRYQKLAEDLVKALAKVMVRSLAMYHDAVIVDETNLKRATREFWCDVDWETSFLHVDTTMNVCRARARAMGDDTIQPVIEKMFGYTELLGDDETPFAIDELPESALIVFNGSTERHPDWTPS